MLQMWHGFVTVNCIRWSYNGWWSGTTGRASDYQLRGRRFDSCPGTAVQQPWASCSSKQYNLVAAKGQWCTLAGKVMMGLMESNRSLPLGLSVSVLCAGCWFRPGPNSSTYNWVWQFTAGFMTKSPATPVCLVTRISSGTYKYGTIPRVVNFPKIQYFRKFPEMLAKPWKL